MDIKSHCARCRIPTEERVCRIGSDGHGPAFCPTLTYRDRLAEVTESYASPQNAPFARMASIQEGACYANRKPGPYVLQPSKCRIEETLEFSKRMGYRRLGLAFCAGLQKEAGMLAGLIEEHGFELASVGCKAGGVPKETIGLDDSHKVRMGTFENMCNPLFQAEVLNLEKTDFNIALGLCVGHDALFLKKAKAFTTVLAVKDRVTGHNPLAPLYTMHTYYQKLAKPFPEASS